ncbi:RsmD family RNA methyltransferase [Bacteroidota bacterium]
MRIISGIYKGRIIPVPSKFRARPTTDFAREGLFNVLANIYDFEGLAVLDLFAGTGSIGFEFTSRGAVGVDMVELDPKTSRFLQRTIRTLGMENVRIFRSDAIKFISHCSDRYDIVFADPPYDLEIIPDIPDLVFKAGLLVDDGWFILEHGKNNSFNTHPRFYELRKYGSVHFSIFV